MLIVDDLRVYVHRTSADLAAAAALEAGDVIRAAIHDRGVAHAMFATGNSQLEFTNLLVSDSSEIPWHHVVVFHMDEYVGIDPDHDAGFAKWIKERIVDKAKPLRAHLIDAGNDPVEECDRYSELLIEYPLDLCCLGIGENGHLAFNDPPYARLDEPASVKVVTLEESCRLQQVNEGHFPDIASVPAQAITVTVPALLHAEHVIGVVPEARKAAPVAAALEGPIGPACPASWLRTKKRASLHLDSDSAAQLTTNR